MDMGEGIDMDMGEVVQGGVKVMLGETGGVRVVVQFYNTY